MGGFYMIPEKKEYFNVIINEADKTYSIKITEKKPMAHELALTTLKNMEKIITRGSEYSQKDSDPKYTELSVNDLRQLFKDKSADIDEKYQQAASKSNWFYYLFFNNEKLVHQKAIEIQNQIEPAQGLPLPNEIVDEELAENLSTTTLGILSQLNRATQQQIASPLLKRAQEFGYQGKDEREEATQYLTLFFKETQAFFENLPLKNYIVYKENSKEIAPEASLKKFTSTFKLQDIFTLYRQENFYSKSFEKIRNYLAKTLQPQENNPSDLEFMKSEGWNSGSPDGVSAHILNRFVDTPLHNAVSHKDLESIKLLLHLGFNPNIRGNNKAAPLHIAVQAKDLENVKLLLANRANPNSFGMYNNTALHMAVHKNDLECVKLLLGSGADPNIQNDGGRTPLQMAQSDEMIALLKSYKANP